MIQIQLICLGKIKEAYNRQCIADYEKRLSHYCKLSITELADRPVSQNPRDAEIRAVLAEEENLILSKLPEQAYVVALAIEGRQLTSEQFSQKLVQLADAGTRTVVFLIGSSHGLSEGIKRRADLLLSFSQMTFPHQLARILLLEQLYRGYRIAANEPYHK